jgi:hypothetical protein
MVPVMVRVVVLLAAALGSSPAKAQVIVKTGILSSPKIRDLGAIFDEASREPTAAKPKTKLGASRPASAPANRAYCRTRFRARPKIQCRSSTSMLMF